MSDSLNQHSFIGSVTIFFRILACLLLAYETVLIEINIDTKHCLIRLSDSVYLYFKCLPHTDKVVYKCIFT